MREENSTYDFERDCKLALEQINEFALSQIKVLKEKYFPLSPASVPQTDTKPPYKIIWNHPDPKNSIYAFHTIVIRYPVIENINFSAFESYINVQNSLSNNIASEPLAICRAKLRYLIYLLEAFQLAGIIPTGQYPHIIIPALFRRHNNKPFDERSIISTASEIRKEINNWGNSKNTINEKIIAVLGKKFTGNLPELRLIFGK